jgi:outer membrane protein assembly factor BamD (BamD/ComL family)
MLSPARLFIFFFVTVSLACSCSSERPHTIKDLDENMLDLKIYQENMGDELKAGKLKDAEWLFEGMDSVLKEVSRKFDEHRKLKESFSYYYKDRMKKPVQLIRTGINDNDTAVVMKGYRLLVKNCNSCHIDLDIDKQVKY